MLVMPPKERARRECEEEEKRQNQIMQGLLNNYDTETVVSDNTSIEYCIEAPLKEVKICGREINQDIRVGYNLADTSKVISTTIDGIKVTNNNDGSISLKGTALRDFSSNSIRLLKAINITDDTAGIYTIKVDGVPASSDNGYLNVYFVGSIKDKQVVSHNYASGNTINIDFRCNEGAEIDCTIRPFIVKESYTAETLPPYEAYGKSPSLEFPSQVKFIEGTQKIEHINKNVALNIRYLNQNKNFLPSIICDAQYKKNQYYVVSFDTPNTGDTVYINQGENWNIRKVTPRYSTPCDGTRKFYIIQALETILRKNINFVNKTNEHLNISTGLLSNFMIEPIIEAKTDEEALKYEPTSFIHHQSEKYQLTNLPGLYSENDYIYYAEEEKKYFVHNEWNRIILKGTEGYGIDVLDSDDLYKFGIRNAITNHELKNTQSLKCNFAITSDVIANNNIRFGTLENANTLVLYLNKNIFSTANELKDFVKQKYESGNPLYVIYKTEKPTEKEITDDPVLIEQLDKLRAIFTYKGTNNFIITAENGQACNLEVTAYKNSFKIMRKEIDNLKALLLES